MVRNLNSSLKIDDSVISYLTKHGYEPQFGARPIKRVIQRELLNKLSKHILSEKTNFLENINIHFNGRELSFS